MASNAAEQKIKEEIEAVRVRQDAEEKAKQFNEMRERNEERIRKEAELASKLQNPSTKPRERISLRQQQEENIRLENERIEAANRGERPDPLKKGMITSESISRSLKHAISRAPAAVDKAVTKSFSPALESFDKKPNPKMFRQESRQLSRVANARTPYPIAGKIQKGAAINRPVNTNPSYVDMLLGKGMQTSKQGKQVQQGQVDPLARLNEFIKRI